MHKKERSNLSSPYYFPTADRGHKSLSSTPPPLLGRPTVEAEDMADDEDGDLSVSRRWRGLVVRPSHRRVAVVWCQHGSPGWKEGLLNSHSLSTMEQLVLSNVGT